MANLAFDCAMTKLIKLLVCVLGDVTSACIKLLSVGMTSIVHILVVIRDYESSFDALTLIYIYRQ